MRCKFSTAAMVAVLLSAGAAGAQSLSRMGGPANLPPAGFDGQQFVDARGCLFLRAGFGANVNWVPRVDRNRKPICGLPPSFGQAVIAAVEADMAPDTQAAPIAMAAPVAPSATAPQAVAEASPAAPAPKPRQGGFWAALFAPQPRAAAVAPAGVTAAAQPVAVAVAAPQPQPAAIPAPPRGYKLAWTDDRLNPLRGVGTAQGQAQQDRVWTREIPADLVVALAPAQPVAARTAGRVTVSTMSAPEAALHGYVQVGSFADPANAAGAKARLSGLGLPVATSQITRKGKILTVVYAGPFAGQDAAALGLSQAQAAGFADAILRMN